MKKTVCAMAMMMVFGGVFAAHADTAADTVAYVNEIRVKNGLPALQVNAELQAAADIRAEEASTKFSHERPDGSQFYTVNEELAYGENLAKNSGDITGEEVAYEWAASEVHLQNMLGGIYTQVGVGTFTSTSGGTYLAALFG